MLRNDRFHVCANHGVHFFALIGLEVHLCLPREIPCNNYEGGSGVTPGDDVLVVIFCQEVFGARINHEDCFVIDGQHHFRWEFPIILRLSKVVRRSVDLPRLDVVEIGQPLFKENKVRYDLT